MSIETNYNEISGYLLVEATGQWTSAEAELKLDETKHEADAKHLNQILLDLRRLRMPTSDFIRFLGGKYLAHLFRPPFRLAALARREDITRFAETVALNRGASFRVFSDEQQAVDWLTDGLTKPSTATE